MLRGNWKGRVLDSGSDSWKYWAGPPPPRGWGRLFAAHVQQAHEGCDFDFLEGAGGIPEPEIH